MSQSAIWGWRSSPHCERTTSLCIYCWCPCWPKETNWLIIYDASHNSTCNLQVHMHQQSAKRWTAFLCMLLCIPELCYIKRYCQQCAVCMRACVLYQLHACLCMYEAWKIMERSSDCKNACNHHYMLYCWGHLPWRYTAGTSDEEC